MWMSCAPRAGLFAIHSDAVFVYIDAVAVFGSADREADHRIPTRWESVAVWIQWFALAAAVTFSMVANQTNW